MVTQLNTIYPPNTVSETNQNINNTNFYNELQRLRGYVVQVSTGVAADTEFTVSHTLGYLPLNVEVLTSEGQTDAYILVKPSGTAWSRTAVYLKCNTATATLTLRIS